MILHIIMATVYVLILHILQSLHDCVQLIAILPSLYSMLHRSDENKGA